MLSVEEIYTKYAIEAALSKVKECNRSNFTDKFYHACKAADPILMKDISSGEFAEATSNWNPGKCGFGEKAQFEFLKNNKFPLLQMLSGRGGDTTLSFCKDDDSHLFLAQNKGSNITNMKSIDFYNPATDNNSVKLFMAKTIDIGPFSNSMDGGHQKNVKGEIFTMIETIIDHPFSNSFFRGLPITPSFLKAKNKEMRARLLNISNVFEGIKKVDIIILIDGRLADNIISEAKSRYQIPNIITLSKSENL